MRLWGLLVLIGCANNVPQDRQTGPDGKVKGAVPLAFENGEARTRGIVTYPGGDRIDWRVIELPEKQKGKLDLQLTWRTPRPGLQVAFDVFDQYNHPIVAAGGGGKQRATRTRTATINDAIGKYFVRIYAPKRGDAGAYVLKANFVPEKDDDIDVTKVPIPDPPRLAALPEPKASCPQFDPKNDACRTECPFDAPAGWSGCKSRDDAEQAKIDADLRRKQREECLKNQPKAFNARIIHVEVTGEVVTVKLDTGSDEQPGLTTGWGAKVLGAGSEKPLANGSVRLVSVGRQQTKATSGLTVDQLTNNPWVRLSPPAPVCP